MELLSIHSNHIIYFTGKTSKEKHQPCINFTAMKIKPRIQIRTSKLSSVLSNFSRHGAPQRTGQQCGVRLRCCTSQPAERATVVAWAQSPAEIEGTKGQCELNREMEIKWRLAGGREWRLKERTHGGRQGVQPRRETTQGSETTTHGRCVKKFEKLRTKHERGSADWILASHVMTLLA